MRERGIIFSAPMVRALLAGHKTQTRRVIKPLWSRCLDLGDEDDREQARRDCPHGAPGDRLWVRETWGAWPHAGGGVRIESLRYRATDERPPDAGDAWRWRPSIHMPRWASRITLELEQVRVERVHRMEYCDALAEGVESLAHFRHLWDSLNSERGYPWASNPWVWAITFRVLGTTRGAP